MALPKTNQKASASFLGDPKPQLRRSKIVRNHLYLNYQSSIATTLFCPTPPLYGLGAPPASLMRGGGRHSEGKAPDFNAASLIVRQPAPLVSRTGYP
ncbi:hypothetical protein [Dysgonomonas gadei]|uniref:hypothetical protein n=1 Tax=Dysgonomonas gadei TaxID=156974 RepID=UPI003AEF1CF3